MSNSNKNNIDDINWFNWDEDTKKEFANQWTKLQEDIIKHYGLKENKDNENQIIEDEYISDFLELVSQIDNSSNFYEWITYDLNIRERELINTFFDNDSKTWGDSLDKAEYAQTVKDFDKEFYVQEDDGYIRNVTVQDVNDAISILNDTKISKDKTLKNEVDSIANVSNEKEKEMEHE